MSNYSIDLNFHLRKCLEIFDKKSAHKIQSKNYKGGKSALPHANNSIKSIGLSNPPCNEYISIRPHSESDIFDLLQSEFDGVC